MIEAVVFDAYGTLLDVHAAMQRHAGELPPDWERISTEWRTKQLEYTWITTLTGPSHYRDFWTITEASLDYVLQRHRVTDPAVRAALLETYRELPAFPDAKPTLATLRSMGLKTAILSNGEPKMMEAAVGAAGIGGLLDAVISVDLIKTYKPSTTVYALAERTLGVAASQTGFVSSNAWDAQGAAVAGFQVFWCNRGGNPAEYGLEHRATVIDSLADLEAMLAKEAQA
ncbi:MAG: haloacid dehalogenase type II [Acetobacteraceae bacterium]|nr:haloacid dehalogenase type II [Acetobacteraceae bacterium]